jgi:hypothetical protein
MTIVIPKLECYALFPSVYIMVLLPTLYRFIYEGGRPVNAVIKHSFVPVFAVLTNGLGQKAWKGR